MEAVAKREPLINKVVEKERLIATLKDEMSHPELAKLGLGDIGRCPVREIDRHRCGSGWPAAQPGSGRGVQPRFPAAAADRITKLL